MSWNHRYNKTFSFGKIFVLKFLVLLFFTIELNFVSKCRQMNKLNCEIIKIWGKYGKKKAKYYELKSPIHGKVYTESCISRYSSNMVKFTKLKHFLSES